MINDEKSYWNMVNFELHEPGQSSYNSLEYPNGNEWAPLTTRTVFRLGVTKTYRLQSSKFPCEDSNNSQISKCFNDYFELKLGCDLPWLHETSNNFCSGQNSMDLFKNLSTSNLYLALRCCGKLKLK